MTILDTIIARKKVEVEDAKKQLHLSELENSVLFDRACISFPTFLLDSQKTGIIAEYKRASPSKGVINDRAKVAEVVAGYQDAGASAVSVLTDSDFFKGDLEDLVEARDALHIPLLRKEFMVDPYQIAEAKAYGADIILLIAAALEPKELTSLAAYAKELGLYTLLEVHNAQELDESLSDHIDAVGVNNRNLKTFEVSLSHSLDLVGRIPDRFLKVSESGISDPEVIKMLKEVGFQGFLIGENFMKTADPALAIREFVKAL